MGVFVDKKAVAATKRKAAGDAEGGDADPQQVQLEAHPHPHPQPPTLIAEPSPDPEQMAELEACAERERAARQAAEREHERTKRDLASTKARLQAALQVRPAPEPDGFLQAHPSPGRARRGRECVPTPAPTLCPGARLALARACAAAALQRRRRVGRRVPSGPPRPVARTHRHQRHGWARRARLHPAGRRRRRRRAGGPRRRRETGRRRREWARVAGRRRPELPAARGLAGARRRRRDGRSTAAG